MITIKLQLPRIDCFCADSSFWQVLRSTVWFEEEGGHTVGEFMTVLAEQIVFATPADVSIDKIFQTLKKTIEEDNCFFQLESFPTWRDILWRFPAGSVVRVDSHKG